MLRFLLLRAFYVLPRLPLSNIHGLALHTGGHALMLGRLELYGCTLRWRMVSEEQVVDLPGLGVGEYQAARLDGLRHASRTANRRGRNGLSRAGLLRDGKSGKKQNNNGKYTIHFSS